MQFRHAARRRPGEARLPRDAEPNDHVYTFVHIVTPTYHADQGLRQLEADHPDINDAMIAAMRPEFERRRREALPQLWEKTCNVNASGLSPEELRQAIAFFGSPTDQGLARAMREAVEHASPPDACSSPDRAGLAQRNARGARRHRRTGLDGLARLSWKGRPLSKRSGPYRISCPGED